MIKFSRIFLISGVFICMNTPAYSLDLNTPGMTGDLNLSSNINSNSSYQLAGLTWLPKVKDSEVGPTGNDMGYNANQSADCSGYKYSTSNCKANNQEPLGNQCLYNHKLFDNCGCNTAKFPISQTECSYSGSVRSQAWLLGGNVCKDQRYSNRMYGKKCLCTSVNFPHTSTATCPSPQTLLDDASKCSYQGVTRYERCKCDTAAGKYEFSSDKGEGYLCSKCTDDYGTHYKCEVVDCPTGQETGHKNNDSCNNGNGTWKETTNKSGSQQCYRCEDISNCDFYKNANGNITVPDTACSWRVYGNYTTTTLPANKSYSDSWVNMWGNSTVNGAFTTNKLAVGGACSSSGYCNKSPRTITFNDLVVVNDVIEYDPFTTMVFKKGVCGNFTCQQYPDYRYSKTGIKTGIKQGQGKCPTAKTSGCPEVCKKYYVNKNGSVTVPSGYCEWRVYGNYATITVPKESYKDSWANLWGNSTVKGEFTTEKLAVGGACSSTGSCSKSPRTITFDSLVTVTNVIEYDPFTTLNFKKGVGGNFTCQQYPDYRYSKTGIVSNIKQGEGKCPCSVTKFAYDSSNCAGTLSGESCGGKYEKCVLCDIGSIIYSDGTCSGEKIDGKTPIGVVSYKNGSNYQILGLEQTYAHWSTNTNDNTCITNVSSATSDTNGIKNTQCMKDSPSTYPAAAFCVKYTAEGAAQGAWYMPAAGEFQRIINNKNTINNTLTSLGKTLLKDTSVSGSRGGKYDYWSSSEKNNVSGWRYSIVDNIWLTSEKTMGNHGVRCIANAVCTNGKCTIQIPEYDNDDVCSVANCKECVSGSSTSCKTCEDGYMELVDLTNGGPTTCVKQLNPIKPPSGSTCNGVSLTCGNNKYCCPTHTGITSCSQINSGQIYQCYIENINNAGICSLDEKPVTCNGVSYCCSGSMSASFYCNNPTLNCRRAN